MKNILKKAALMNLVGFSLLGMGSSAVAAATVYYKGSAVYWDYGRTAAVYSYSNVQSSVYDHTATANGVSSGWKAPGVLASASAYIGGSTAQCYWNCRG
ncbi:hypothetical protein HZZ02_08755 [Streptococcus danieliae]|nr:hypothetical protein [Streptococcus danieliae]